MFLAYSLCKARGHEVLVPILCCPYTALWLYGIVFRAVVPGATVAMWTVYPVVVSLFVGLWPATLLWFDFSASFFLSFFNLKVYKDVILYGWYMIVLLYRWWLLLIRIPNIMPSFLFAGEVVCEPPNNKLDRFCGTLHWKECKYALTNQNMLLRGCVLRNTESCYGLVIFAGMCMFVIDPHF